MPDLTITIPSIIIYLFVLLPLWSILFSYVIYPAVSRYLFDRRPPNWARMVGTVVSGPFIWALLIYEKIDQKIVHRRRKRREATRKANQEEYSSGELL